MKLSTMPHEMSDDEVIGVLIAELSQMKNPERMSIVGGTEIRTVAQLMDHLRRKTPQGLRHVELYRRARTVRAKVGTGEGERTKDGGGTGVVTTVRSALSDSGLG